MRTPVFVSVLGGAAAMLAVASRSAPGYAGSNTQVAHLYQLEGAFHCEASVHDPVNGDSAAEIDQRIRDMLSLWTDHGSLLLLHPSLSRSILLYPARSKLIWYLHINGQGRGRSEKRALDPRGILNPGVLIDP